MRPFWWHVQETTYVFGHNAAAWVGIVLCVFLLCLWLDRNAVYLKQKRKWEDD